MPSDSNGLYSLPAGYLATTGLTILASQHNPPLEDIASGLTARLMRSGVAPMTGVLKIIDGAVGAPALALNTAPTWGLYKTATGWGLAVSGAVAAEFNPTATILPAALTVAGNATVSKTLITKDGGDIASANALTLGDGNVFNITGTTAITSIATKGIGTRVWLRFNGILTLTYHATNLILTNAANITTAAADWGLFEEYGAGTWRMLSYQRANGTALAASLPRGFIDGCVMVNGTDATNDINIGSGSCRDSTNAVNMTCAALTKQLDANWAPGTAAGMRNSAAGIANATYHIYAIAKADGTQDYYATPGVAGTDPDASAAISAVITAVQAESGGSAYLYARRIGSIIRSGATILAFTQIGNYFQLTAPVKDIDATNPGTSAVTATITVPLGIVAEADVSAGVYGGTANTNSIYVSALSQTDAAPQDPSTAALASPGFSAGIRAASPQWAMSRHYVRTNTSAQIRYRILASGAADHAGIVTNGWRDWRGTNA